MLVHILETSVHSWWPVPSGKGTVGETGREKLLTLWQAENGVKGAEKGDISTQVIFSVAHLF